MFHNYAVCGNDTLDEQLKIIRESEAYREQDIADYEKSMEGIYTTSVCASTIDEAPDAYKPAELIEQAIGNNAEILEHIYPIYNFKAKV